IGEFETSDTASTIRVYRNTGTNSKPRFTDQFTYAKDTKGTNIAVPQWCCIGITPQFIDLDNDGFKDMITGQYHPGEVTWFRGSKQGFLPGVQLEQAGKPKTLNGDFNYWNYSSASFGDMDGDGLPDLVTGGSSLRVSKNIGTRQHPKFGYRYWLLDIYGDPLDVAQYTKTDSATIMKYGKREPGGDGKLSPFITDWDHDGVLDLLVTSSYRYTNLPAVTFFRGVKVQGNLRFERGVPLFKAKDGSKAFPGSGPRVTVGDWNNDSIDDLIIGASVPTLNNGIFNDHLAWTYEDITGIEAAGKDPGRAPEKDRKRILEQIAKDTMLRNHYLGKEGKPEYLTLRHRGYVYVFPGQKNPEKAKPADTAEVVHEQRKMLHIVKDDNPVVQYTVSAPAEVRFSELFEVTVHFNIAEGWHIYAPTSIDNGQGMIVTSVAFELPRLWNTMGPMEWPASSAMGLTEVYRGNDVVIKQRVLAPIFMKKGVYTIKCKVAFQTCNEDRCLPPQEDTVELNIAARLN
ncbi:MAG TPA: FG-GAP-like repeat-containing protein, partial [Chitinophaga sp.]|uniref:FG-GAP-like repeat-containing protein n=1 Tax=Chitinophaga sp. TaxID=1869181 RepID=UPI002DBADE75